MARSLRSILPMLLPLALSLAAGGCSQDPFERPGTWRPVGANESNLRAMVANKNDLVRGQAALGERGDAGANAARRLLIECRRQLPLLSASTIGILQQPRREPPLPGLAGGADNCSGASRSGRGGGGQNQAQEQTPVLLLPQ